MPKKKTATTDEKTAVEDRVSEFLGEDVSAQDDTSDTKVEEEVIDKKTEEEPKTPIEEPKAPEVDTKAIEESVTKKVLSEISEKLTGKTSEERKEDEFQFSWEKESRNPRDYSEMAKESARYLEYQQALKQQEQEKQQLSQSQQLEQRNKDLNSQWDQELADMAAEGLIPKVVDKNNQDDPGAKVQTNLFTHATKLAQSGKLRYPSLRLAYAMGFKPNGDVAGADAPIGPSKKSVSQKPEGDYSYEDIHDHSLEELSGRDEEE